MKVPWDRGGLRTYLVVLALVFARPGASAFWWGAGLLWLGVVLHVYAKGCLRQDQTVSTGGPYRFVRHPFYSATLMIDMGIAVMSGWWPLMAALPLWWLPVYYHTMRQEEAHLTRLFPDTYPEYQRRLPRLVPFRRPLPAQGERFSWRNQNITSDAALPRGIRLSAYPLAFWTWDRIRAGGLHPLWTGDAPLLTALTLLFATYVLSGMLIRHLRDRQRALPRQLPAPAVRGAMILLVLTAAGVVRWAEFESHLALPLLGGLVVLASTALYLRGSPAALYAEGLGLAGVALLCELPWLAALPALVYAGLMLDARLAQRQAPQESAVSPGYRASHLIYLSLMVTGMAVAVAKEVL